MKLTYKAQLLISVAVVILSNILTEIFDSWIYRSVGFVICGLLWIVHPVLPEDAEMTKRTLLWTRLAGAMLILIGVFTRVHY